MPFKLDGSKKLVLKYIGEGYFLKLKICHVRVFGFELRPLKCCYFYKILGACINYGRRREGGFKVFYDKFDKTIHVKYIFQYHIKLATPLHSTGFLTLIQPPPPLLVNVVCEWPRLWTQPTRVITIIFITKISLYIDGMIDRK